MLRVPVSLLDAVVCKLEEDFNLKAQNVSGGGVR